MLSRAKAFIIDMLLEDELPHKNAMRVGFYYGSLFGQIVAYLIVATALLLNGCNDLPSANGVLPNAIVFLKPGDKVPGRETGLCKFGWLPENKGKVIWGWPDRHTQGSPYGDVDPDNCVYSIPSQTWDGCYIISGEDEGNSADKPTAGWIEVRYYDPARAAEGTAKREHPINSAKSDTNNNRGCWFGYQCSCSTDEHKSARQTASRRPL